MERVCDLYALANIEADRAWFLERGRLSAGRSKAVIAAVDTLCAELRPHARSLVDAFQIPEQYLAAPMLETGVGNWCGSSAGSAWLRSHTWFDGDSRVRRALVRLRTRHRGRRSAQAP